LSPVENDKLQNRGEKIISPLEGFLLGTSPTALPIDPADEEIRLLIKSRMVPTLFPISSTSIKVILATVFISSNALRISTF
tara:strand:- start:84 stop:326 length:243 start_codon:yes stop_codon:yes gene_type:complete